MSRTDDNFHRSIHQDDLTCIRDFYQNSNSVCNCMTKKNSSLRESEHYRSESPHSHNCAFYCHYTGYDNQEVLNSGDNPNVKDHIDVTYYLHSIDGSRPGYYPPKAVFA